MTTIAVSMVRDEADIVEHTLRHMATQVDAIIVADNASIDDTRDILDQLTQDLPLTVLHDPEVGYFQSRKMSALAALAAQQGAQWVLPFDQDELWYSPFGRIADILHEHPGAVAAAALYDHRATGRDPADGTPFERMGWRTREPLPLFKVACRPLLPVTIDQGNHGARYPTQDPLRGQLVVRHFPIRSPEQMVRKARNGSAAYAATDLPQDAGGHWRGWGRILEQDGEEALHEVFRTYYWYSAPEADPSLIFDPAPAPSPSSSPGDQAARTAGAPGAG